MPRQNNQRQNLRNNEHQLYIRVSQRYTRLQTTERTNRNERYDYSPTHPPTAPLDTRIYLYIHTRTQISLISYKIVRNRFTRPPPPSQRTVCSQHLYTEFSQELGRRGWRSGISARPRRDRSVIAPTSRWPGDWGVAVVGAAAGNAPGGPWGHGQPLPLRPPARGDDGDGGASRRGAGPTWDCHYHPLVQGGSDRQNCWLAGVAGDRPMSPCYWWVRCRLRPRGRGWARGPDAERALCCWSRSRRLVGASTCCAYSGTRSSPTRGVDRREDFLGVRDWCWVTWRGRWNFGFRLYRSA